MELQATAAPAIRRSSAPPKSSASGKRSATSPIPNSTPKSTDVTRKKSAASATASPSSSDTELDEPPLKKRSTLQENRSDLQKSTHEQMTSSWPRLVFVFGHGAGGDSKTPWMQKWARYLTERFPGSHLTLVDYVKPWNVERLASAQAETARSAVSNVMVSSRRSEVDLVFVGKSMGSRVACYCSNALLSSQPRQVEIAKDAGSQPVLDMHVSPRAVICLGYPLVGQKPNDIRSKVLEEMGTPVLFCQGTRDKMCPLSQLEAVRASMTVPSSVHVVDTGDHSLTVTKRCSLTQEEADKQVLDSIGAFLKLHGVTMVHSSGV